MPIVRIEMFEGRDAATKQKLVEEMTDSMHRLTGCSKESVNVVITDIPKVNWGLGGELAATKFPDK